MMEAKHTPAPWHLSRGSQCIRKDNANICEMWRAGGDEETRANAAFIVQACNSHDELVAALKTIAEHCEGSAQMDRFQLARLARAAMAKAEAPTAAQPQETT